MLDLSGILYIYIKRTGGCQLSEEVDSSRTRARANDDPRRGWMYGWRTKHQAQIQAHEGNEGRDGEKARDRERDRERERETRERNAQEDE